MSMANRPTGFDLLRWEREIRLEVVFLYNTRRFPSKCTRENQKSVLEEVRQTSMGIKACVNCRQQPHLGELHSCKSKLRILLLSVPSVLHLNNLH